MLPLDGKYLNVLQRAASWAAARAAPLQAALQQASPAGGLSEQAHLSRPLRAGPGVARLRQRELQVVDELRDHEDLGALLALHQHVAHLAARVGRGATSACVQQRQLAQRDAGCGSRTCPTDNNEVHTVVGVYSQASRVYAPADSCNIHDSC